MKFYLIRPNEENSSIYLDAFYQKCRIRTSTALVIPSKYWDDSKQRITNKYSKYLKYNNRLNHIKAQVEELISELKISNKIINSDEFRVLINQIINPEKSKEKINIFDTETDNVLSQFHQFIILRESSKTVVERTIGKYKDVYKVINDFAEYKNKTIYFNDLNNTFYDEFYSYLTLIKRYRSSSIESILRVLATLINYCVDKGIVKNENISKRGKIKKDKNKPDTLALSESEVEKIKCYQASVILQKTKDLFLFQIETMLRFSDLMNLKKENIDLETQELKLWQLKTSSYLRIPLSTQSIEMISKYKEFPKMNHGNYIASIKRLCRFAGIDTPTENVTFIGKQRISEIVPKYKLIGTHTARRTGITLLLTRGLPADIIMKISGHKDINSFQKYVRITQDTAIDKVRSAWEE